MGKEKQEPGTVRMNIVLPSDLETEFREAIYKRKGMKKGNISEAFTEAVQLWLKTNMGAPSRK
ncbi:MAG: hypothetical protein HY556_05135 [Euryarchaeota archaeon]|nr:hypothetical protein [Euryarchaeota archaeon]